MKMNRLVSMSLLASMSLQSLMAFAADSTAQKSYDFLEKAPRNSYGQMIYPFVAPSTDHILERVRIMSEDRNYLKNFQEIVDKNLSDRNTQNAIKPGKKPWMSTYWPLNKGLIADPYRPKINILKLTHELSWKSNHKRLTKRHKTTLKEWASMDQEDLDKLAPSEKYDILIGDENFTLTKKVVKYMKDWGSKKENASTSKIDKVGHNTYSLANMYVDNGWVNGANVPFRTVDDAYPTARKNRGGLTDVIAEYLLKEGKARTLKSALEKAKPLALAEQSNYVIKEKSTLMALWEGICHGWATAAGIVPRPRKTVKIKLDNGRTLKFYPTDMKALASYMWANSLIQDGRQYDKKTDSFSGGGILMQGMRCNDKKPARDSWGRVYDDRPDAFSDRLEPRCVGVHPAIWHLGLVNIIGKQGRSFIVERKISEAVDNHPMHAYKAVYFNPYTGEYDGSTKSKIEKISDEDQFKAFRNPEATHVIGVKMTMNYINWNRPERNETDDESMDEGKEIDMLYDLELNAKGDIVGGQWRTKETGKGNLFSENKRKQPDFFWAVTKDWKPYFQGRKDLPEWKDGSRQPPSEYKEASLLATANKYYSTPDYGWYDRCELKREKKTDLNKNLPKYLKVNCEHIYEKPQPLIQVVNKLIEMAQ
jgi:hypothetical protein